MAHRQEREERKTDKRKEEKIRDPHRNPSFFPFKTYTHTTLAYGHIRRYSTERERDMERKRRKDSPKSEAVESVY